MFKVYKEFNLKTRRFRDFVQDVKTIVRKTNDHITKNCAMGISSFSGLFNHSCVQDVAPYVTSNMDRIYVAVKTIKKGSQVIILLTFRA